MSFTDDFPAPYRPLAPHIGQDEDLTLPFDSSTPTVTVEIPATLARLVNAAAEFYAVEPERVVYEAVADRLKFTAAEVMRGKPLGAQLDYLTEHQKTAVTYTPKAPDKPW